MISMNCPMCEVKGADSDCPVCYGKSTITDEDIFKYWLSRQWTIDEMRNTCMVCKKESGGVPWAPVSHGLCSNECALSMYKALGGEQEE